MYVHESELPNGFCRGVVEVLARLQSGRPHSQTLKEHLVEQASGQLGCHRSSIGNRLDSLSMQFPQILHKKIVPDEIR